MKKLFAILLTIVMVMGLATTAMAQSVDSGKGGNATITIENASKGETYKIVKIFDASVTGEVDGSIAYTGTIPEALETVFKKDSADNISVIDGKTDKEVTDAVSAWAKTLKNNEFTASAESDGSALTFTGLKYGYYAVVTSQGAVVTIDSTNPNATVYDKNTKEISLKKDVNDSDVDIGQEVIYTATFNTTNYVGSGKDAQKVEYYVITDTLPEFLTDVKVTGITIGGVEYKEDDGEVPQFGEDKLIKLPWTDENGASLYKNGAVIVVTYSAKVTDEAVIDGTGNENIVSIQPFGKPEGDTEKPLKDKLTDNEIIYTYAAALQKVDENKKPLAGAKFAANGLEVTGSAGVYTVVSYDPTSTTPGTEMECDSEGQLVILGLSTESVLTLTETKAPEGYNKLVSTTTMTPVKTDEEVKATAQTIYYDANGNVTATETEISYSKTTYNVELLKTAIVVVNQKGAELPETGGMGTTLFYILGGVLVLAAVVLLVTKRRMNAAE